MARARSSVTLNGAARGAGAAAGTWGGHGGRRPGARRGCARTVAAARARIARPRRHEIDTFHTTYINYLATCYKALTLLGVAVRSRDSGPDSPVSALSPFTDGDPRCQGQPLYLRA